MAKKVIKQQNGDPSIAVQGKFFEVGERFEYMGKTIEVVEFINGTKCGNLCAFKSNCKTAPQCMVITRKDKISVWFKPVQQ